MPTHDETVMTGGVRARIMGQTKADRNRPCAVAQRSLVRHRSEFDMNRVLTAAGLATLAIGAGWWLRNPLWRRPAGSWSSETQIAQRLYLNKASAMKSILARMRRIPSYRPRGFSPGTAGLRQAEKQMADGREAEREIRSEGDA